MSQTKLTPREVLKALNDAGHESYFVGGCVRDHIIGRPCKDFDIATAATPPEITECLPNVCLAGSHFGLLVYQAEEAEVQIATFRSKEAYKNTRAPWGFYTKDVSEDLQRRDFTMNALLAPHSESAIRVVDRLGQGMQDIMAGRIRAVGFAGDRFREDPLRMLRACRFAAQLDFTLDEEVKVSIRCLADTIKTVPVERVMIELGYILRSGRAEKGFRLMDELGLLRYVLPEIVAMHGVTQNPKHHPEGDVFEHTMRLLAQLRENCPLSLGLAALLHDVGKPPTARKKGDHNTFYGHEAVGAKMTRKILDRLRFPSEVISRTARHVADHMKFMQVKLMRLSKVSRLVRQPHFDELLELHRMDSLAGCGDLSNARYVEEFMRTPQGGKPPKLVTGKDLINAGIPAGPIIGQLLESIENLQIEGGITGPDEALEWAVQTYGWIEESVAA